MVYWLTMNLTWVTYLTLLLAAVACAASLRKGASVHVVLWLVGLVLLAGGMVAHQLATPTIIVMQAPPAGDPVVFKYPEWYPLTDLALSYLSRLSLAVGSARYVWLEAR